MKTWFTSDLHIGHTLVAHHRAMEAGICAPWEAPEIDAFVTAWHDRTLAAGWDESVKPDDLVWVLGDISAGGSRAQRAALEWLAARPGRKRLIAGNHDGCHPLHRDSHKWQPEYLRVFETVQSAGRIRVNGVNVLLSHFPYWADRGEVRYMQWRLRNIGEPLIHGHTHSDERLDGREIHVGLDAWNLKPVVMQNIEELVAEAVRPRPDIVAGGRGILALNRTTTSSAPTEH